MTENKINILFARFRDYPSVKEGVSEEEQIIFEQNRLKIIEDLARALVDYYNMNTYTKPKTLSLEEIKVEREKKHDHSQDATFYMAYGLNSELKFGQEMQASIKRLEELEKKIDESHMQIDRGNKAKEIFDRYYHTLFQDSLNNPTRSAASIKQAAISLTFEYFKGIDELGNSPWDPRK